MPVMSIEEKLRELGLELPQPFAPPPGLEFKFDLIRVSGDHAYVSGHGPFDGDRCLVAGKVGDQGTGAAVSLEQGQEAARLTGLSILASLRSELGDLDRVISWVKVLGLVNCAPGFNQLILELWGDAGRHARSAIGAAELPFDMPVEVEAVVEIAG